MDKFRLSKRCRCPRRAWTNGCRHTWHYAFQWKRRRHRGALDDVLGRHVGGKAEALKEVEKIYDAVRDDTPGKKAGRLTLRQLGETYFDKYVSPKTSAPLGRGERYRWNLVVNTIVDGKPLGDFIARDVKKHHVESFVDANRIERTATIIDAKGKTYQTKRGGVVSTNRSIGRLKALLVREDLNFPSIGFVLRQSCGTRGGHMRTLEDAPLSAAMGGYFIRT